jgi:hypothetical protein
MEIQTQEMRLTKLLSKVIITEVSQKLANQLLSKFKETTTDSDEIILAIINKFDQYKEGITDTSKRDITKYTYNELKNFILTKELRKLEDSAFKKLKKKWDNENERQGTKVHDYRHDTLKSLIKKFYMIQPYLNKEVQDIMRYGYLDLVGIIQDKFEPILTAKALEHFKKTTQTSQETILWYLDTYLTNIDNLPENTKPLLSMSFEELEHLVDGSLSSMEATQYKNDYSDVDIVYDDNNLLVFAPKTKDQCIKLAHGRSWCTSREGGSNLYYNYRLNNNRTLYYVLDQDLPYSDLNFASVILVDPYGGKALADGSNSGKYSGHQNIPWSDILGKIPKLQGLEDLLEPKPLTDSEKELISKVRNISVGDDVIKSLGDENTAEMWMEINSPRLNNQQYESLPPSLQKKYIALGFDLTGDQIKSSDQNVLSYYVNKKKERLMNTSLEKMSSEDLDLLSTPMMKGVKESLKTKFLESLTSKIAGKETTFELAYPNDTSSKFAKLYGMEQLLKMIPNDVTTVEISNSTSSPMNLTIPEEFRKFKDLEIFYAQNALNEIPDQLRGLQNLQFINISNSPNITEIPEWIADLPNLAALVLHGVNPNIVIPPKVQARVDSDELTLLTS